MKQVIMKINDFNTTLSHVLALTESSYKNTKDDSIINQLLIFNYFFS